MITLKPKDVKFDNIIISKDEKEIQENGNNIIIYEILYNGQKQNEKKKFFTEIDEDYFHDHTIEFFKKNKDDFQSQMYNIIKISKEAKMNYEEKGDKEQKCQSFLEWFRDLERHVLGIAYEENFFPVELNEQSEKLVVEMEEEDEKEIDLKSVRWLRRKKMRFIRDAIISSGQESSQKIQEETTQIVSSHLVYLKAIVKEEDDFDHIQKLLKDKNKHKTIVFSFPCLFYNKRKKQYGIKVIIEVKEKNKHNLQENNNYINLTENTFVNTESEIEQNKINDINRNNQTKNVLYQDIENIISQPLFKFENERKHDLFLPIDDYDYFICIVKKRKLNI